MWTYQSPDDLYHSGVKGMRWGVRRAQNRALNKLGRSARRAMLDGKSYSKTTKSYANPSTGNTITMGNSKKRAKAIRSVQKTDQLVAKLSKKYTNVSAIPGYDTQRGKSYVDVTLGSKTKRVYE